MSATEERKVKLVGHEVRLDPTKGGMLYDPVNEFTFSFFKGGTDRLEIKEGMDTTLIEKNIKPHGILRVFSVKGTEEKDVTDKFGGPPKGNDRRTPLVKEGLKQPDNFDNLDEKLVKVLDVNDPDKIEKYVESITDYQSILKLIELEKMGNNPTSQCRRSVLDMLEERKKHVSGIAMFEDDDSDDEELTVK